MMLIRRLAIIGVGLIGGSLARALRERGEVGEVVGGADVDVAEQRGPALFQLAMTDAVFLDLDARAMAMRDALAGAIVFPQAVAVVVVGAVDRFLAQAHDDAVDIRRHHVAQRHREESDQRLRVLPCGCPSLSHDTVIR